VIDRFLKATLTQYGHMKSRKSVIAQGGLPFTLEEFRQHVLKFFGDRDGIMLCRYCRKPIAIDSCAVDHAVPLSRGGSVGLENLEFPCARCNSIKGRMTPMAMTKYCIFRDTLPPEDAADLDNRLLIAVKSVAGNNWKRKKAANGMR
jgi:hypothetical protein